MRSSMFDRLTSFFRMDPVHSSSSTEKIEKTDKQHKPVFNSVVMKAIWSGSKALQNKLFKSALERTPLQHDDIKSQTINPSLQFPIIGEDSKVEGARTRFQQYNVFPPFPTQPTPVSDRLLEILQSSETGIEDFLTSQGVDTSKLTIDASVVGEIVQKSNIPVTAKKSMLDKIHSTLKGKPSYKDLSPQALKLYQALNFAMLKEHLKDIHTLSTHTDDNTLGHFGLDYLEMEVTDTLARGLAYIDKSLLQGQTIEIPVKINGEFVLKEFNIERFSLSDSSINPQSDHTTGHPVYFLTPTDNEGKKVAPIIVARGTLLLDTQKENGALDSVKADGRKDISLKWIAGNRQLEEKIKDLYEEHGAINVCGHSLGGNIASILPIAFPAYINQSTAISAIHVNEEIYETWSRIDPLDRPFVTQIPVEGDLVPGTGNKMVGSPIAVRNFHPAPINPTKQHLIPFNNRKVEYFPVDKQAEQAKNLRKMNSATVVVAGRAVQGKAENQIKKYLNKLPFFDLELKVRDPYRKDAINSLNRSSQETVEQEDLLPIGSSLKVRNDKVERAKPRQIYNALKVTSDVNKLFNIPKLSPQAAAKIWIAAERSPDSQVILPQLLASMTPDQQKFLYLLNESENDFDAAAGAQFSCPSLRDGVYQLQLT